LALGRRDSEQEASHALSCYAGPYVGRCPLPAVGAAGDPALLGRAHYIGSTPCSRAGCTSVQPAVNQCCGGLLHGTIHSQHSSCGTRFICRQHSDCAAPRLRMPSSGVLHRVALVRTKVSEERISSIIRVGKINEPGTLAATSNRSTLRKNTMCKD
jgi:hypothetical protein